MKKIFLTLCLLILCSSCASIKPHPRPWTRGEKIAAIGCFAAIAADYITTENLLDKPGYYETNHWLGEHPSDTKLVIMLPISGIFAVTFGHWYPELRFPLLVGHGFVSTKAAINNSRLD